VLSLLSDVSAGGPVLCVVDAYALLDSTTHPSLDQHIRDRIVAEARATRSPCWSCRAS
jgi:hypothetical protein